MRTTLAFPRASDVLVTPVRPLRDGAYVVRWEAVSTEDGHPLQGTYSFGVRAPAVAAGRVGPAGVGVVGADPRASAVLLSLLLLAGGLLLRVLLPDRGGRPWLAPRQLDGTLAAQAGASAERLDSAIVDIGICAVSSAMAVALVDTLDAAGSVSG